MSYRRRNHRRNSLNYHITEKVVITLVVGFIFGYPAFFAFGGDIMTTIWATLLTLSIPLGIMYCGWVD